MNENDQKTETTATKAPTTAEFTMTVTLPYAPPQPMCCSDFQALVDVDQDARIPNAGIVTFRHSVECDVWQYL